jgi:hypothetical protein
MQAELLGQEGHSCRQYQVWQPARRLQQAPHPATCLVMQLSRQVVLPASLCQRLINHNGRTWTPRSSDGSYKHGVAKLCQQLNSSDILMFSLAQLRLVLA